MDEDYGMVCIFKKSETMRDNIIDKLPDESEEISTANYDVFPGIRLIYTNVHVSECNITGEAECSKRRMLEIDHCREGRLEHLGNQQFFYLSAGDIAIHKGEGIHGGSYYPTRHYHGITIAIDLDEAPKCLSCFLDDVEVSPEHLASRFCADRDFFVARSTNQLEHIFAELYHIPEKVKKGYFKIKVLEILLFLSTFSTAEAEERVSYTFSQVQLAKDVCRYLVENMDSRTEIDKLAKLFHVSASQLKKCFRGVYGESIYSYTKELKMKQAAMLLTTTNRTVLDIAGSLGYRNGSKFASAFCDVMGMRPNEYRQASISEKH